MLVVAGISHRSAPLGLRECLALDEVGAAAVARALIAEGSASEAVALSTCNRVELYGWSELPAEGIERAAELLSATAGATAEELGSSLYRLSGPEAVAHLFRVTAGLESMVIGEAEIVAQVKQAYRRAGESRCTAAILDRLFRQALSASKRVRTETAVGAGAVSVASAAAELAVALTSQKDDARVLVLGAGETGQLAAAQLRRNGVRRIMVTNRTAETAGAVAARIGAAAVPYEDLEPQMAAADVVLTCTAAPHCVVSRQLIERVAAARQRAQEPPLVLVDIAVPRDIEPSVRTVRGVLLRDLDDLREIVHRNQAEREREAQAADAIIADEVAKAARWLRSLDAEPTIADLRRVVEEVRLRELERFERRLDDLTPEQRTGVEMLTAALVKKILHAPTVELKAAAERGEAAAALETIRRLFALDERSGAEAGSRGGYAPGGRSDWRAESPARRDAEPDAQQAGKPSPVSVEGSPSAF